MTSEGTTTDAPVDATAAGERPEHGPSRTGERVSTVLADRVCTGCLFNLAGQPVYRESHYKMLIVVCPECGTAASIQEYPHLGKWSRRGLMLLAAAWFCVLIGGMVGSGGALFLSGQGLLYSVSDPMAMKLSEVHVAFHKAQADLVGPQTQTTAWYASQPANIYSPVDPAFLLVADMAEVRDSSSLLREMFRVRMLARVGLAAVAMMFVGIVWATVLPHARFGRRLLVLLPMATVAAVMLWAGWSQSTSMPMGWGWQTAQTTTVAYLYWPWAFGLAGVLLPAVVLGLAVGRPVARCWIRFLLPPRLREPLDFLWLSDGLKPAVMVRQRGQGARTKPGLEA